MKYSAWLASSFALALAGCPDVNVDPGEGVGDDPAGGPEVQFDPSNKVVPFPNNLLLDPATGKVNLPEQCNEGPLSAATRVKVLNTLDGFGTYKATLTVSLSEAVDPASLANNVLLYKRASAGTDADPAGAQPIPVVVVPSMTTRFADQTDIKACKDPQTFPQLVIVPMVPLEQKSTYVVALVKGIKTASGAEFGPSFTWSVVREAENPVTLDAQGNVLSDRTPLDPRDPDQLAQLRGIDLLWKAHAKALAFLAGTSHAREDVLLAWEFNTQTTTDPLDPLVAGSLAATIDKAPLFGVSSQLPTGVTAEQFLQSRLPPGSCAVDGGSLPCQAVGDVVGGLLSAANYQTDTPAKVPTNSTNPNEGGMIPGPFNDPYKPTKAGDRGILVLGMVPASPMPAAGYPVIVFGHGLGSSKSSLVAIGAQLAAAGYASVAIDFVAHDSRAVRTSTDAAIGCANTGTPAVPPSPTTAPQCYAPFLSSDLATTRDNVRQTILDLQELVNSLQGCALDKCNQLKVDVANIQYLGLSLGGIIGSATVGAKPDFRAAVLNVPGVGWVDILENSNTNAIKCPLVDALIDAKILTGEKSNLVAQPNTGLCTTDAWKTQPGYQQFATIARWALDPADPANFTRKLATRRILIQEVVGDTVVPNVATNNEAALVGLQPLVASRALPPVEPSAVIMTSPQTNKFVKYMNLPPEAPSFPGNTFEHASLLRPAPSPGTMTVGADGRLGTARLQTDAITFLLQNKAN
ncbi:MAG: hypothetical protein JNL83_00910 [Myxococcales bacterium]|nr:hypothetical protein [Myxococcales bacterium]